MLITITLGMSILNFLTVLPSEVKKPPEDFVVINAMHDLRFENGEKITNFTGNNWLSVDTEKGQIVSFSFVPHEKYVNTLEALNIAHNLEENFKKSGWVPRHRRVDLQDPEAINLALKEISGKAKARTISNWQQDSVEAYYNIKSRSDIPDSYTIEVYILSTHP